MAKSNLQKCKSCGAEIAKGKKVTCPQCGKVNKKPFYQRPFFIGIAVILVISMALGGGGDDDEKELSDTDEKQVTSTDVTEAEESEVAAEEVEVQEKVEPIIITVDELEDALEENALKAADTYKDKYMEVTGKLSVIDSSGKYFSLGRLDNEFSMTGVTCNITKDHLDDVMEFEKEQNVTVIGTISDVGEIMGYRLKVETIK